MEYLKMIFLITFFILILCSITSTTHCVGQKRNLIKEEVDDVEIERQLRALNKKPVKTIITEVGDVVDCIDIYKQPAFDNPLLKDHKIQMSPILTSGETRIKNVSASSIFHGLQRERCPSGAVPIRRITREDLVNDKFFAKRVEQTHANDFPNFFVAAEQVIPGIRYFGGAAYMSIHNLTVDLDQFSTSQIWIVASTSQGQMNGINFGIMKNPTVVGGDLPRLFGLWVVKNGHQVTGCYNVRCGGFIQIHTTVYIDQPFLTSSIYGSQSYDAHIMVAYRKRGVQGQGKGGWWLKMGPSTQSSEYVGYWPGKIFTLLGNGASAVRYGGSVGSTDQPSTPPMGNGFLPQLQDYRTTAYMRLMKYVNEEGEPVDLDPQSVVTINGVVPQCYNIMFARMERSEWKNYIAYGGPGGYCN